MKFCDFHQIYFLPLPKIRENISTRKMTVMMIRENISTRNHLKIHSRKQNHAKICLTKVLSSSLRRSGYKTIECTGDADVTIVKRAIDYAEGGQDVVVAAEDTDILILLIYHWREDLAVNGK